MLWPNIMQKGKMVLKICPKCEKQVPVACKACPCGHIYFHARKPGGASKTPPVASDSGVVNAVKRRRIEQVNQARATRGRLRSINEGHPQRSHRSSTSTSNAEESDRLIEDHPKKRRARQKPSEKEEKAEQPEEDVFANKISPDQALRYSIVLAEINRKLGMSQNLPI